MGADDLLLYFFVCFFIQGILEFNSASCGFFALQKLKEMNLDEWKNIRGPRPWEDSREYQEQQRRKLSNKD